MSLASPKSAIFMTLFSVTKTFLAAKSRWMHWKENIKIWMHWRENTHTTCNTPPVIWFTVTKISEPRKFACQYNPMKRILMLQYCKCSWDNKDKWDLSWSKGVFRPSSCVGQRTSHFLHTPIFPYLENSIEHPGTGRAMDDGYIQEDTADAHNCWAGCSCRNLSWISSICECPP